MPALEDLARLSHPERPDGNTASASFAGIFDPFGFSKGNIKELQTKEIKNGANRLLPPCCRNLCSLADARPEL